MTLAMDLKKQILASQIALKRSQNNEKQLEKELSCFFKKLKKEVLSALEEYWSDYQMLQGHINLICSPVHEAHREYYEILEKYVKREYKLGEAEAKRTVNRMGIRYAFKDKIDMPISGVIKKDTLFGTHPEAENRLLNNTFTASENTMNRVDGQINQIITDGYRSGKGIDDISNQLTKRFDQLQTWEAKRIARTEVHNAHTSALMNDYEERGVEYVQWIAAGDDRTRDSHIEVNGEIVALGDAFSNGLTRPGDTSGPIEEWINCRCSFAPFVIPFGYLAPSFSPFREDDLVKVDSKSPSDLLEPQQPVEEQTEQLKATLTKEELDKLTFDELAAHHGVEYKGVEVYDYDGKKYHRFDQTFDNGRTLTLRFEEGAVKSYTKAGIATPNEIINEVFNVPEVLKRETNEIWFKNTSQGIQHKYTKTRYDSFDATTGGYNLFNKIQYKGRTVGGKVVDDFDHRIVINPKYFKGGGKGKYSFLWEQSPDEITKWKKTIDHEFWHSGDGNKKIWDNYKPNQTPPKESYSDEYLAIHKEERYFTQYANTAIDEAYAEHGGYITSMLNNPADQSKTISIQYYDKGKRITKDINFEEYKEMYPKNYEYFTNKLKGGF